HGGRQSRPAHAQGDFAGSFIRKREERILWFWIIDTKVKGHDF
ncbi:MAG: hypothetical protein RJA13_1181, partial [Bacteroidota bacterium]